MGHFSYSCQLSGLPITDGTKCAILPMLPREKFYDNSEKSFRKTGKSIFCSNEGVNIFFNELSFPIFGTYDGYGNLEDIIKDDNTKSLEEYFELTIEDIVTVLCDGRKDEFSSGGTHCDSVQILNKKNPKHMILLKASLVWLNTSLYEKLSNEKSSHWDDHIDLGEPALLERLGFKFKKEVKKERYNQLFEKDGLKINSDGTWIDIKNEHIYNLKDFKKYCNKNNVDIDIKELDAMQYHEQIYEILLPTIKDITEEGKVIRLLLGDEYTIKMSSLQLYPAIKLLKNIEKVSVDNTENIDISEEVKNLLKESGIKSKNSISISLSEHYFNNIQLNGNGFLKKNIIDWFKIKSLYYSLGRYLYPIGTSSQDGDYNSVKLILEHSLSVVKEQILEYGSDEDDVDEDDIENSPKSYDDEYNF